MTPADVTLLVDGWNAAQEKSAGKVQPPTADQMTKLRAMYPDDK